MKSVIKLTDLSIGFRSTLMENINAELHCGELTALMGVNGIGKSCLIKTLVSFTSPIKGNLFLAGKDYRDYSAVDFAKNVAVVLTDKIQIEYLTVHELVTLGRSPYTNWFGTLSLKDELVVEDSLEIMGIKNLKSAFISELSDGQKQKAMIARALAQKPRVLILDEPSTYLDIPSKIELFKVLKQMAREWNLAILLSSHELQLCEQYADTIWLMGQDGEFLQGSPEKLRSSGQWQNHFKFE